MHVLLLARDVRLASGVKEWLDRRHVGLTCLLEIAERTATMRAVTQLQPSAVVVVCRDPDLLVMQLSRQLGLGLVAPPPRFIVVAEHVECDDRVALLDGGADAVLQPVDPGAVERWLYSCDGRSPASGGYRGPDLSIDADGETVFVRGRRVALTPREAALLRLLVHHRDGAVNRRKLEQSLWGILRSRTLDVHIARLRKKLGPAGRQIQTVVKFGYRYVEPAS